MFLVAYSYLGCDLDELNNQKLLARVNKQKTQITCPVNLRNDDSFNMWFGDNGLFLNLLLTISAFKFASRL